MYQTRLKTLRENLILNKIDGLLISSPKNVFYLTGIDSFSHIEREAYLFVTESNATLFTDPRYIEAVEKILPPNIKSTIKPMTKVLGKLYDRSYSSKYSIGFEKNLTFAEYEKFKKEIHSKFILTYNIVEKLREIKDSGEITTIKKAAKLTDDTFGYILPLIKPGVTEQQIAFEMEMYIKKYGGTLAFDTIVAFGPNSSVPHHMTSEKKLSNKDELILLDFGAKIDGYCCDMTRTILTKTASNRAKKIYQAVLDAQAAAANFLNNKTTNAAQAAITADKILESAGFPPVPHGLGHGVGLEVHEKPTLSKKSKDELADGMVFTIEPGIYIPGFGGVRIEDTVLFHNGKVEQLTKSTKTLDSGASLI